MTDDDLERKLQLAGQAWASARIAERQRARRVQDAVIEAVHAGMSESRAAVIAQCDRMTIRKMLGK